MTQKNAAQRPTVIETISENDWMFKSNKDKDKYLSAGWSVGRVLKATIAIAEIEPQRI